MKPKKSILGLVATLLIVIIGTTGLVFASTKLYNEHKNNFIKKTATMHEELDEIIEKGYHYFGKNENTFLYENMLFTDEISSYYKVITDIE